MLAIAAPSFDVPSETFIRAHIRTIAPDSTVLICNADNGASAFGYPVLSHLEPFPPPQNLVERTANSLRFRWRDRLDPALDGPAEQRVRAFLLHHRPCAVLAEYGTTGCRLRLACRRARIPLFVHFHGFDATKIAAIPYWQRNYRRLFRDAAGIIAPSRFLADRLAKLGCPDNKLHVSPCGVEPGVLEHDAAEPGHIVAIGRLVAKKAPDLTISAFARARSVLPHVTLDVVGDGPLMHACAAAIETHHLRDCVELHGTQPPSVVRRLLSGAVLFAQHSLQADDGDTEGLPVGILEAMAAGLPVVSTRHAGIPEAVVDGETGLLVEERDVDGMAQAMIALLQDPERARRMGEAGRARVLAHFTHDHVARRLRTIMGLPEPVDGVVAPNLAAS